MLNLTTFTMLWGFYLCMGNCLSPMFAAQFTSSQLSIIGIVFVLSGLIGCYIMGIFLDKTQSNLLAIRGISLFTMIILGLAIWLLSKGNIYISVTVASLCGLFCVPVLPSTYGYAVKLTFGISPTVVNGLMMSSAQLYAFVSSLLAAQLLLIKQ